VTNDDVLSIFKAAVSAMEFRDRVGAYCRTSRTVYETDLDTIKKVFEVYWALAAVAVERGADPGTIRGMSGKELVRLVKGA
jgi:hypothetical protein